MFVFAIRSHTLGGPLAASPDVCMAHPDPAVLSVDPRASPHPQPLLPKLFVDFEVNKGHPSLNAASSKRTTAERDDSNLRWDNRTSVYYESRDSLVFSQQTDFCFLFLLSLVIGHTWVSELLRPDTEICKQKMGNSHLALWPVFVTVYLKSFLFVSSY